MKRKRKKKSKVYRLRDTRENLKVVDGPAPSFKDWKDLPTTTVIEIRYPMPVAGYGVLFKYE